MIIVNSLQDLPNDPLEGVCKHKRDKAIEAIYLKTEKSFQLQALNQLQSISKDVIVEFGGEKITEELLFEMNHLIRSHILTWVVEKRRMGFTNLNVEDFLYRISINPNDPNDLFVKWPVVYEQLEQGTAPFILGKISKQALHELAREWLDENEI